MKTIYPQSTLDKLAEIDRCIDIVVKNTLPKPPKTATEAIMYARTIERAKRELIENLKPLWDFKVKVLAESPVTYVIDLAEVKGDKK